MTHGTLQLDSLNEQNLQVMQAYAAQAAAAKAAARAIAKAAGEQESEDSGFDGWLERLNRHASFTSEELTQIHGQLIALGFLKFEISGRSVGLRYKISPRGKQAMERAMAIAAAASNDDSDSADTKADNDREDDVVDSTVDVAPAEPQPADSLADAA